LRSVLFDLKNEKIVGDITVLTGGNREITHAELSPDGSTFVARQISPTQEDIILLNRDGTIKRELTHDQFFDRYPRWSPDGKKIVFISDRSGKYEIWTINADGTNPKQITDVKDKSHSIPAWSPDGTLISFDNTDESFILDPTKDWNEKNPQKMPAPAGGRFFRIWDWSPDGRKLIGYSSPGELNGSMIYDFYTKNFEKVGDLSAINYWLPDSRRIIYANDGKVFITDTETKKTREIEFPNDDFIRQARLSRDGKLLYFSVFNTESDIWLLDLTQN
jgi:TolB protein